MGDEDYLNAESILEALKEHEFWTRRLQVQKRNLKHIPKEMRPEVEEEIVKIKQQISYYEHLLRDMKKDFSPPRIEEIF